jgi:apolipoprotein N-acyltransferase
MRMKLLLLTLLSCLLFPLALPNELFMDGNPFLGLFCLSFLFWAIYESPSYKFAALMGALFGGAMCLISNIWLKNYNEFAIYTLGMTTLGYMGLCALLAAIIRGFSRIRVNLRPFVTAALFAVWEYLKSTGFVAFPYSLLSQPVHTILPLVQFIDITGQWGLSFLIALFSSLLAEVYYFRFTFTLARGGVFNSLAHQTYRRAIGLRQKGLLTLALVAIAFVYGGLQMIVPAHPDKTLRVLLIQQNVDPWRRNQAEDGINTARALTVQGLNDSLAQTKRLPDLVVWSETALRFSVDLNLEFPFKNDTMYNRMFPGLFEQFNTATLTGAPAIFPGSRQYSNAAILVTKDGRVPQYYAKQHPVPFVESIPFMEIPFMRNYFEQELGLTNVWQMGKKPVTFNLPTADGQTVRFGAPICFEDVYGDVCRDMVNDGAEALINITNDSWSGMNSALSQHTAAARYRAIETRTPLLRSTNAGLTCVIDPTGAIVKSLPYFQTGYLLADVPVRSGRSLTLYALAGDYLPYLFAIALIALLLFNAYGEGWRRLFASLTRRGQRKTGVRP